MIIDCHAHLYPATKAFEDWDFTTKEEEARFQQRARYTFGMHLSVTRSDTNEEDKEAYKMLWDKDKEPEWSGLKDVGFRVEDNNYVWEKDGVKFISPGRVGDDPEKML